MKSKRGGARFILISLLIIVLALVYLGALVNFIIGRGDCMQETQHVSLSDLKTSSFFSLDGSNRVKMYLPAVDAEGNGTNTVLTVEASKGTGRTLTDIDNLLFWADTQHSIRIARRVAENITGKRTEDYDIVYTIEANASLIGGPSAGAALTIATISALNGKKLNDTTMITGTINHDGSIGPVSGILEKAIAAKDAGATLFLVPLLQSRDVIYETSENCETFGSSEVCTTETKPKKINVEQESGIEVMEVETIDSAMKYFFN